MTLAGDKVTAMASSTDDSAQVQAHVEEHLFQVLSQLFPFTKRSDVVVRLMGSRMYGLAQKTSDADFAVALPDFMLPREREI